MKFRLAVLLAFFFSFSLVFSQTDEDREEVIEKISAKDEKQFPDTAIWNKAGLVSINFSQVSLTNWAGGGQSSISSTGILHLHANLVKKKSTWDNSLDMGYGFINQGGDFIKTDDKIDLTSKYGRYAGKKWYYSALLNFKSQFDIGYDENDSAIISNFFAPAYVLMAIGLDHKPNDNLTFFISPATAKFTYMNDQNLADQGAFGVEAAEYDTNGVKIKDGQTLRTEIGGYVRLIYSKSNVLKNVGFQTKLELFSGYLGNPENIDVLWETIIDLKINDFLSANITTNLIYDDDIDIEVDSNDDGIIDKKAPRTQFKEVFALGISYKF